MMAADNDPEEVGTRQAALELLHALTGRPDASFRDGQLDAISAVVDERRRVLLVQRTGWGKSAVYFIATRLLRQQGAGPTLLVSPLLALMRDQIRAAVRIGVRAESINSTNATEWDEVIDRVGRDEIDVLLVSPERLGNADFREQVLGRFGGAAGLIVIDEAHCISDWGHDFRPDYRRIRRLIDQLPRSVPLIACTATANDRVVADVEAQLGDGLRTFRGPLARPGLALQVIPMPSRADRLAWLADTIPTLGGAGIVYCLTKADAEQVAGWLHSQGITAASYTGDSTDREQTEDDFLANRISTVVATSALGMGFDKPDLHWVIHYQAPSSVVAYYQQVGRAGRQLQASRGVLLCGHEDADIHDWFATSSLPTSDECDDILSALDDADGPLTERAIEHLVNVRQGRMKILLKNLEVDGVVERVKGGYVRTVKRFRFDRVRLDAVLALRHREAEQMRAFAEATTCRMEFLARALDDPDPRPCGICDRCTGAGLPVDVDPRRSSAAARWLRRGAVVEEPRKQWPTGKHIAAGERIAPILVLGRWADGGWSDLVAAAMERSECFDDRLVEAASGLVQREVAGRVEWVTWVPSLRNPAPVEHLARSIAAALGLPAHAAVRKVDERPPQRQMQNSTHQWQNLSGAFEVADAVPAGPVLLVDDTVDSKWTLTVIGAQLRAAGSGPVLPFALTSSGG